MWHLYRASTRPLISVCHVWVRQRTLLPMAPALASRRLLTFPSLSNLKRPSPEYVPQPPVNPRHPPDYIPPRPPINPNGSGSVQSQSTIWARFRHAYAKYGKILLVVHFVSSFMWLSGLIFLHFNGFDLGMYLIDGLTRLRVISEERRLAFIRRMNEFSISGLLSRLPLVSDERLADLKAYWTGERVRLLATALLFYKFSAPLRYAFSLGVTTFVSRNFLKRGLLKRAPHGDSLQELYRDQKQLIKSHVRRARETMRTSVRRGAHKSD